MQVNERSAGLSWRASKEKKITSVSATHHLLEINTALFLRRMRRKYGPSLSLLQVPLQEWCLIREQGFSWVWLMGLWQRSPEARAIALREPFLREAYSKIDPLWKDEDVLGSPYAVFGYEPDPFFGEKQDLPALKKTLREAGLKLMVDFVPNHLALDHPWTETHPEYFIRGNEQDLAECPKLFFRTPGGNILAHGKDPYFDPWSDTVQVNFFSEPFREKSLEIFKQMTHFADGVRCDMAMLALTGVFSKNWEKWLQLYPRPAEEYWTQLIRQIKASHPFFVFMAETYWDLEGELQSLGFDATYDKRLYDRLVHAGAVEISEHLSGSLSYQKKSVRFIENHDELRAAAALGREKSFAAAMICATLPGLKLWMDGQQEGRSKQIPVQIALEPQEAPDEEVAQFYSRLWAWSNQEVFQKGEWKKIESFGASERDESFKNILAWSWQFETKKMIVVINYANESSRARFFLPAAWMRSDILFFHDEWAAKHYARDVDELRVSGLFVELGPWQWHGFSVR